MILDEIRGHGWFTERAKLYQEMAEHPLNKLDEVQLIFRKMEYGWLDTDIYVNGELRHKMDVSLIYSPISDMSKWLSDVVDDNRLMSVLEIDEEGVSSTLCYEHLFRADNGLCKKERIDDIYKFSPLWRDSLKNLEVDSNGFCRYDADICFDYGMFYVYDSGTGKIPAKAMVKTKDFINGIYMSFLDFMMSRDVSGSNKDKYILDLYNEMKSSMVEWNMNSKDAFRHRYVKFKKKVRVADMVVMDADYGDALFWSGGCCCGTADYLLANNKKYDLTSIGGMREWYDDYDENGVSWDKKQYENFYKKERSFADKVRELLPDNIDLCCCRQKMRYDIKDVLPPPQLVPNIRMWEYPNKR